MGPPKPGAQELNRADLAKNVNENLDTLEDIVKRRPELFGPWGKGLLTSVRSWAGTEDKDIAALHDLKDNLGRASQGAHGMRSGLQVESAANAVVNSFRNGPEAILRAIQVARNSVNTFIRDVAPAEVPQQGNSVDVDAIKSYLKKKYPKGADGGR